MRTRTRNLKRLLSLLLCTCMVAGLLPGTALAANASYAGPNPNATSADHNTHIIVAETATNNAKFCPYTTYSGYNISAPAGMSYDQSTNTLTLNNYNGAGYYIQTNMMGSDFKVQLIGTNVLDGMDIWGAGWGCGLTFTGSGTLTVNGSMTRSYGLQLNGEGAEPILHVDQASTVTVYGGEVGHAIFLEGSTSLSASPITYGGTLTGGTPVIKRPNLRTGNVDTGNGVISCLVCTKNGDSSGTYYGFSTAYVSYPSSSITYNLWKLTGTPASSFIFAEKVTDESGNQVSYSSTDGQDPPPGVLENYTMVQGDLANWSISSDGDFLHPAPVVIFSPGGAEVPDVLSITTTSLPGGKAGETYTSTTLTATGYDPSKSLTWTAEGLPAGLTLSSNGTLSGTPTQSGSFIVKVTAQVAGSAAPGTTARRSFVLSIESNPFRFTLSGDIDSDLYGRYCYLKGMQDDTELTLWSGELKQDAAPLIVSNQYLGTAVSDVKLVYYPSGSKEPVIVAACGSQSPLTLTDGGRAALTSKGDVLVLLPQMSNPYNGVSGSLWFQDSSGVKYFSGTLAPSNASYTLGANLYYANRLSGDPLYTLDSPAFEGTGVSANGSVYTYNPPSTPDGSPIALKLEESKLTTYNVQLVQESGDVLPDLSGAQVYLSQRVASSTYSTYATVAYQNGTNYAAVELYSGVAATPSLSRAGQYFLDKGQSSITPPTDSDSLQLTVLPAELKDMTLAVSAMPAGADQDETLAEYAQLMETTFAVNFKDISLGGYSAPTDLPKQKYVYASYRADTLNNLYTYGDENLKLSWKENGPVNTGSQIISWSKESLSERAELTIDVKGGVLAEVTNQSDTVYFSPWWYNESKGWRQGSTVRVGVDGGTESLALWCPGSTDTATVWNLLLLTMDMVGPSNSVTWAEAKEAYPGMPYQEGISVQNNHAEKAAMTVKKDAVESILYPTKPYSTFVGPSQFDSTDDLLVYTGHIQLKEGFSGKLDVLRLDAAGTDSGGRVATQISSVVVNGVEYPYTRIEMADETNYDQLVSKQFQTYYQIAFREPVELPCDITVYAKPMLEASDAVLTASVRLKDNPNASFAFHLVGKAVVKAPDLSVSVPSITGNDTVTAYVTAPANAEVQVYDGDELVATAWNGSVEIPLWGTSTSMTTSHRLTFQYTDASGTARSVTRTVLHAEKLPTVTTQYLQQKITTGWRNVSRNTIYSFTSANPAPFRMTCTIENAENIAGNVSFAVRFLDGTIRYIEATQSGKAFTTEAFTSSSPVIGAQVLYEIDWDKVQAAMNANLKVPGNTLGGSNSFESTIVLPWSDYKNELTQYQEAFQYLEDNKEDAQKYQTALEANGDQMKEAGTLNFGRASSRDPVDVNSGAKTAQEMFDHLDKAAITDLKQGQTLYTGFTRQVTQAFFQAELGSGSGFSRLILADGNDIKYEMYVKLIELANKEGTGTLVLAADYVTGGDGNPLYMEIGSVAVQGTAATASAANIGGGGNTAVLAGSALAALPKSGATRDTQSSAPSSGGYYFTDIGDNQTMSAMDYASCVSDGYVTGMTTGLDVINTAGYYIDGTVDSVGESGFAGGGYTTALSLAGVGKATYDTAVNYSTLGDLANMSENLLNTPCAKKLAESNPRFIENMKNQLADYKKMLDDAGAWNIGMGAYNIVNGAVGTAGGYAIPWVTLATAGLGMFGDAIVKQKISNCEATGTVLYDTMQLFIKKYANQTDDPECKGGGGNPNDKDKEKDIQDKNPEEPYRACIDPSGVVYEAVLSNPVEGATVTLYTDETDYTPEYNTADNGNGKIPVMVNADGTPAVPTNSYSGSGSLTSPVDSTIPTETVLTTGADGRYQWMVTEGLWYVTAHKEGYLAGNSGNDVAAVVSSGSGTDTINWLPVSPEQLNVNIPLVSYETPTVTDVQYRSDGVYLTFSKYMDDTTLKAENFSVYAIGDDTEPVPITVKKLNSEQAPSNINYGQGKSAPWYTSQVKLEIADNAYTLSDDVAVTIANAVVSYAGVPYTTKAAGNTISGTVSADALVAAPTISPNGGEVDYGTAVTITFPEGAAVYYTTDGSMPNKDNGTRYYEGQTIPVTRNMTLKVVAVKFGQTSSPVTARFTVPSNASTMIGDPNNQPGTNSGGGGGSGDGGGGGGSGGSSSYSISVPSSSSIKGGSITVSPQQAAKGDTVTITVTPDKGYELEKLTVTDAKGNELVLTPAGNNQYTFSMPGSSVKIEVSLREAVPIWESCTGGAECPAHLFTDVNTSAWYHKAVDYVLVNGLMSGYGNGLFGPDDILSRAQLCQLLYNKEGRPAVTGSNAFSDVADDAWYADAVIWANEAGIVGGYGGGVFGADDPITREQLAVILWRYVGSPASSHSLDAFTDAGQTSTWAVDAMRWANENGVVNGDGSGHLMPNGNATRVQVAQMIKNFLENIAA